MIIDVTIINEEHNVHHFLVCYIHIRIIYFISISISTNGISVWSIQIYSIVIEQTKQSVME